MPAQKEFAVYTDTGLKGTLLASARFLDDSKDKRVRLEDGREITVPAEALVAQADGSFRLHMPGTQRGSSEMPKSPAPVNPVAGAPAGPAPMPAERQSEPEPKIEASPRVDGPVKAETAGLANHTGFKVGEQLFRELYDVKTVRLDRIVDAPMAPRNEGDTLILPVMEEVLVVEKKLMLKEELHITRRRETVSEPRTISAAARPAIADENH